MTHRDFCYWLQGHLELAPAGGLSQEQVAVVREHLKLVFVKETTLVVSTSLLRDYDPVDLKLPGDWPPASC